VPYALEVLAIRLRLEKQFLYRGQNEIWGNTYHLSGAVPTDQAEWQAIAEWWSWQESAVFGPEIHTMTATGYKDDSGGANVFFEDYGPTGKPGRFSETDLQARQVPGDCAATIRWWMGKYSKAGKKIYARKYFHGTMMNQLDLVSVDQLAAYQQLATNLAAGVDVTGYAKRSIVDKDGNGAVSHDAAQYVTTRTLKKRGKSPH
jgi:hypothetical protein